MSPDARSTGSGLRPVPASAPTAERDGLRARLVGDHGPVIAAAHGMEDDHRAWGSVAALLADRYRVVLFDLPWHSGNDYRWRERGTSGQWLSRALDLARELTEETRIHALVGHSFGANASLELLAGGLDVDRAALLAPFYRPSVARVDDRLWERSRSELSGAVSGGLRMRLAGRKLDPELVASMERGLVERVVAVGFPVFFESFSRTGDLDLARVTVPTLVLGGTADPAMATERAHLLAAAMPAATVRVHSHFSHFCHMEQAEETAAELATFLDTPALVPHALPPVSTTPPALTLATLDHPELLDAVGGHVR